MRSYTSVGSWELKCTLTLIKIISLGLNIVGNICGKVSKQQKIGKKDQMGLRHFIAGMLLI